MTGPTCSTTCSRMGGRSDYPTADAYAYAMATLAADDVHDMAVGGDDTGWDTSEFAIEPEPGDHAHWGRSEPIGELTVTGHYPPQSQPGQENP